MQLFLWRRTQVVLHWLSVVVILGLYFLGDYMVGLDYYHPWYQSAPFWHKSIGLLFLVLMSVRLTLRLSWTDPPPIQSHQPWERLIASITHAFLYIFIFVICISGYLISTADGRGISVFGWLEIPAVLYGIDGQEDVAGVVHEWTVYIMLALGTIHGMAALKHHFIDKDDTLRRMLLGQSSKILTTTKINRSN